MNRKCLAEKTRGQDKFQSENKDLRVFSEFFDFFLQQLSLHHQPSNTSPVSVLIPKSLLDI